MARRLPSLNALKAFEAAARHQGFTAAADELCVTHAAVSKQIRELEEWLGTLLFVRNGRGVTLTAIGRRLGTSLTGPFDRIAEAIHASAARSEHCGLKISVDAAMASRWLMRRLPRFNAAYPSIDLEIELCDEFDNPRAGQADLFIRFGTGDWKDADAVILTESRAFAVCSPKLLGGGTVRRLEDMSGYVLLHHDVKEFWFDWLAKAGVRGIEQWRGMVLKHLAYEAAEEGQGFALADYILATDALLEGKLVLPFDVEIKEDHTYFIVRPKGTGETGPARAFREWLTGELQETLNAFMAFKMAYPAA